MGSLLTWLLDYFRSEHRQRVEVLLRVHRAILLAPRPVKEGYSRDLVAPPEDEDCYFLNVFNASPERRVQVTHVWIEAPSGEHVVHLNAARPLPTTIEPRHEWETWVPVAAVPPGTVIETAARAKLADDNGTIIVSTARENVPPAGMIPG